ncbi:hypothetical protein [Nocardioides yefusunii]|uniref:Uncharacterized protein n=1 Tax=Nocardioides yefusunii TaxID=2500546 RepID=A0ABW1R0P3_9ACTN|nr:hypothetical protein [Nocardioides yefusunii]
MAKSTPPVPPAKPGRVPRPPIAWATHSMHIMMVVAVTLGGTGFGLAFALWPTSSFERILGIAVLAAVAATWVTALNYVLRPVERRR